MRKNKNNYLGGINLQDLANALTDPASRFEFPVKPFKFEIDFSPASKSTIYIVGGAIALGLFLNAINKK